MTNAELAILSLVAETQRHGYEIEQIIEIRGMREWTEIGFSSIYYLLNKLERAGQIASHNEHSSGKGPGARFIPSHRPETLPVKKRSLMPCPILCVTTCPSSWAWPTCLLCLSIRHWQPCYNTGRTLSNDSNSFKLLGSRKNRCLSLWMPCSNTVWH